MINPAELSAQLAWRYATKKFTATKKIPAETWAGLRQSLAQTSSSFGLQPWKYLILDTPALKTQLRAVSWGQTQVEDAAHQVVFLARQYDETLGLNGSGYHTVVACPVGYRAADDKYAGLAKIHFAESALIEVR